MSSSRATSESNEDDANNRFAQFPLKRTIWGTQSYNRDIDIVSSHIRDWEEQRTEPGFDPIQIITSIAGVLEIEATAFACTDPDPHDDRHPNRAAPAHQYGTCLKTLLKRESLINDLFGNYTRDTYYSRHGSDKDSRVLNAMALRLIVSLLPAIEPSILWETDGLLARLFTWAIGPETSSVNPPDEYVELLKSYGMAVLAGAVDRTEIHQESGHRERINRLIPVLLDDLRALCDQAKCSQTSKKRSSPCQQSELAEGPSASKVPRRPFAQFSSVASPISTGRRCSTENASSSQPGPSAHIEDDLSNSSWADMEWQIFATYQVYPLTLETKIIFTLRLLTPLAELQEFLSFLRDGRDIRPTLSWCINMLETKSARMSFESTRLLTSLFCHKRFALDWLDFQGMDRLLNVPRPSVAASGVAQCFYFLSCEEDTLEKVCMSPNLEKLVRYMLWCLDSAHESGRQFAIMFFYNSFVFRTLLTLFDQQDGLRRLYNAISTLRILSNESYHLTDDEEYSQKFTLKLVCIAFKKYFEAHLGIKYEHYARLHQKETYIRQPSNKAIKVSPQLIQEEIEALLAWMPLRTRWAPVDKFSELSGIETCLRITALAYDWTFTGRAEMVRSALDTLSICTLVPKVQMALCSQIDIPNEDHKFTGIDIVLSAARGEIVTESADIRRSALHVIINCVCGPFDRPERSFPSTRMSSALPNSTTDGAGTFVAPVNAPPAAESPVIAGQPRKKSAKTAEELVKKLCDAVRSNNGIMNLLELLHIKFPLSDADSIRALACRALVGLARSESARQIMSKLPIFTNGQLQQLVREPILQDKRAEHAKFQRYAYQLITSVSDGQERPQGIPGVNDLSLELLHRASVVAQTEITFSKKQLLQLIQEYLMNEGLSSSASCLQKEANLNIMNSNLKSLSHSRLTNGVQEERRTAPSGAISTPRTPIRDKDPLVGLSAASRSIPTQSSISSSESQIRSRRSLHKSGAAPTNAALSYGSDSTPIKGALTSLGVSGSNTPARGVQKAVELKMEGALSSFGGSSKRTTLVDIVSDYLSNQHSLCKNPMTTCPEFDLFQPHKCPDPRPKSAAPVNFCTRFSRMALAPPYGGPDGAKLNRKLVYSRFRSDRALRAQETENSENTTFCSVAYMPEDTFILAGTERGEVKMFSLLTGQDESTYKCHESSIYHIQPDRSGKLLLTSCSWRTPYSILWSLGDFFEQKLEFMYDEYTEFSKLSQNKIIGTQSSAARVYDVVTGDILRSLKPSVSNQYTSNRATFDPTDDLVLNDGVLFDLRMAKEIRKLDKLNATLNGIFHPNGLEIISNTEVWDLRTFQLLKTVPELDQCHVVFSNSGDIIYAVGIQSDDEDEDKFETSFKTFDASDYSSIATFDTRRNVLGLASSQHDLQLAVVENSSHLNPYVTDPVVESVVRLYDVGRVRAEEEEEEESEEEEEGNSGVDEGTLSRLMGLSDDDDDEYEEEDDDDDDDDDSDEEIALLGDSDSEEDTNEEDGDAEEDEVLDPDSPSPESDAGNDSTGSWEDVEREEYIGGD